MEQQPSEIRDEILNKIWNQPLNFMARPKEITVERLFPTGNYLNIRIGMTWSVGDENPNDVMKVALNMANQFHRDNFPHLYTPEGKPKYELLPQEDDMRGTKVTDVVEGEAPNTVIEAIKACNTMEELKGYWLMSKGNLTYSAAYKEREKQLKNEKQHP